MIVSDSNPWASRTPDALLAAADDPAIFRWTASPITDREQAQKYIAAATDDPNRIAFAQVNIVTNAVVGTTSMYQIDPVNRSLAIGYTWLSRSVQGTGINPESKLLLLRHAFDQLEAVRVEWHTDEVQRTVQGRDPQSSGAQFEGLLRKHRRRVDGSWRTTALFAMTDDDWPTIAPQLETRTRN